MHTYIRTHAQQLFTSLQANHHGEIQVCSTIKYLRTTRRFDRKRLRPMTKQRIVTKYLEQLYDMHPAREFQHQKAISFLNQSREACSMDQFHHKVAVNGKYVSLLLRTPVTRYDTNCNSLRRYSALHHVIRQFWALDVDICHASYRCFKLNITNGVLLIRFCCVA